MPLHHVTHPLVLHLLQKLQAALPLRTQALRADGRGVAEEVREPSASTGDFSADNGGATRRIADTGMGKGGIWERRRLFSACVTGRGSAWLGLGPAGLPKGLVGAASKPYAFLMEKPSCYLFESKTSPRSQFAVATSIGCVSKKRDVPKIPWKKGNRPRPIEPEGLPVKIQTQLDLPTWSACSGIDPFVPLQNQQYERLFNRQSHPMGTDRRSHDEALLESACKGPTKAPDRPDKAPKLLFSNSGLRPLLKDSLVCKE